MVSGKTTFHEQFLDVPIGKQEPQIPIMDMLADGTGGTVITSASDPVAGLARIAKEQSEYYVLGYTPSSNQEKNCHFLLEIGLYVAIGGQVARLDQGDKRILTESYEPRRFGADLFDNG